MSLRLVSFGFASALLLIAGSPAFADDATIMNNDQANIITGDRNTGINTNNQHTSIDSPRRGNTGTSMGNRQINDISGNDNYGSNENNNGKSVRRNRR
jgi:hypothetical protein